ncbi:MAG: SGNH/GDSL hydrolase family protein [Clostridia bacterium]|nr:SGNH/GDSL hydrolase family protein [Clostridia bacterium]
MDYYKKYVSNCAGSAANQFFFYPQKSDEILTSRCFFKITESGEFNYSFLFTNTVDSTFGDGSISKCNDIPDEWHIKSLAVSKCSDCSNEKMPVDDELESGFIQLTFDSKKEKTVAPAEIFATDPVKLNLQKGEYLCFEMEFCGRMIPYHEETLLPVFRKENDEWIPCVKMPLPAMIGCDRNVQKRITFIGDSITQGCGTPKNKYLHYSAFVAENLGSDYAYWNIGIGYARGHDAATDGAWLQKAKQTDIITVCFGVNDILQGYSADEIKNSLRTIVQKLKEKNITVILQTIPPFDYDDAHAPVWFEVNDYINNCLYKEADGLFDTVEFLSLNKDKPQMSRYGTHPNEVGHKIWGDKLSEFLKKYL